MLKGFFIDRDGNVHLKYEKEESQKDKFARELVEESNRKIEEYNEQFISQLGTDEIKISDWFVFQEGLLPLVREAANLVHQLHEKGYTKYKINMQSGIISE